MIVLILDDEECNALIYTCEDIGGVYIENEDDETISDIGNILLNRILPRLIKESA